MKKGTFTSVWDGGEEVTTNAELDEETGEVIAESIDVNDRDLEYLDYEYFSDEEGNDYRICPTCHAFIMSNKMFDGVGHSYDEKEVCSDPDCESN